MSAEIIDPTNFNTIQPKGDFSGNGHKPEITYPGFLDSYFLPGDKAHMAMQQIPTTENGSFHLARNPLSLEALTIAELEAGQKITVYGMNRKLETAEIYQQAIVKSEPYFKYDDMWWVDVEMVDLSGNSSGLRQHKGCLGIWGVTLNDNCQWNPFYYTVEGWK